MINEQVIYDSLPDVWPENQQDRLRLISELKKEFETMQVNKPSSFERISKVKQQLALEGPYYELYEEFNQDRNLSHKLHSILISLHQSPSGAENITNLKQNLNSQKLQKLVCDIYRLFNKRILDYQAQQIEFATYTKLSVSILKKALNQNYLDQNCINFICHYGSRKCTSLYRQWTDFEISQQKYTFLAQNLKQIKYFNFPRTSNLKQYWNQQQITLCYVLFCIIQCEELIALSLGEERHTTICIEEIITPQEISSDDYSWNLNGFSLIRDYFPKLAHKLNRRFKSLKHLPVYNQRQRINIFSYAQSLLGYQNNQDCLLEEELKLQVSKILQYQTTDCNPGLVILVANAKLYTQLMYSLM